MKMIRNTLSVVALLAVMMMIATPQANAQTGRFTFEGRLNFLRVHEVGTGFGSRRDFLNAEVIFSVETEPNQFFGFQLRNDENALAHQAMLEVLRDAFFNDVPVAFDADVRSGITNSPVIRVWLSR
jgi:hypothetical protein